MLVAASPHDAVTNHALGLREALGGPGRSRMFARYVSPALAEAVEPLEDLPDDADVLVYHASIGEPAVAELLEARPEPLVLVYHNITPAEFFELYDHGFAERLRRGRVELARLARRTTLAVSDSELNAAELVALGYRHTAVLPPIVDFDRLARVTPEPETTARLAGRAGALYLSVGQLLPHKRVELVVQAFHVVRTYLDADATLVLAGESRLPAYAATLRRFVADLAVPGVEVPGAVPDEVLAAYFRHADAFVTASEHEGFCVPLVEAMSFGVPAVARAFAAVPSTLDGAGLLLGPADGPAVMAEALHAAATDPALRGALVERGWERLAALRHEDPGTSFAGLLEGVA